MSNCGKILEGAMLDCTTHFEFLTRVRLEAASDPLVGIKYKLAILIGMISEQHQNRLFEFGLSLLKK